MLNSYLRLEHESTPHHPLFKGREDAPRIINGVWRLEVEPRETFPQTPITLIPSYPDLPMEKVYPRQPHTNISAVYLRDFSSGEAGEKTGGPVAYLPWDIDRTFWEVLCEDHFKLLRNTVEWATNEKPMFEVSGSGLLDVTAWHDQNAIVIHLVNLTNPMTMKGPYREFFPLGEQTIKVLLPDGMKEKGVRLLVADATPRTEHNGREVTITVPSVLDHEVVAINL